MLAAIDERAAALGLTRSRYLVLLAQRDLKHLGPLTIEAVTPAAAPITPPAPAAPITQKPPGQFAIRGPDGKIVDVQTFEQKPVATPQKKEVKSC